ncbi:MAG: JAB domain-containing protein [Firmicutes bacterium]|nr:JAB domain-containing protein [Bacillota bacterium]
MSNSKDVYDIAKSYLYGVDREHFVVIMLDIRNYIIGINTVTIGNIKSCIVNPREVFKPALIAGASSDILVHNHPTGDPYPSPDDLNLTDKLKRAGDILEIKVLDHIIVTDSNYISLSDKGQI